MLDRIKNNKINSALLSLLVVLLGIIFFLNVNYYDTEIVQAEAKEMQKNAVQASPNNELEVQNAKKAELKWKVALEEDKSAYDGEILSNILEKNVETDGKKIVFLTFDDGPSTTVTPMILDILKQYDVKATFPVIGVMIESNEASKEILRRTVREGHALMNHSYTHDLQTLYPNNIVDVERYMEEIKKTNDVISSVVGEEYVPRLIRMPGGYMSRQFYNDPNLEKFNIKLKENNIISIDWNAYIGDADFEKRNSSELFKKAIEDVGSQGKVVLLMHDTYGKEETAYALPQIIQYFKDQQFEFKTIR